MEFTKLNQEEIDQATTIIAQEIALIKEDESPYDNNNNEMNVVNLDESLHDEFDKLCGFSLINVEKPTSSTATRMSVKHQITAEIGLCENHKK